MTQTSALAQQISGTHYKGMGIQPIQFVLANQWDAAAFSTLKYLARHPLKNKREDVLKGRHFVELRQELIEYCTLGPDSYVAIPIQDFIQSNQIKGDSAWALTHLSRWVYHRHDADRDKCLAMCDSIIRDYDVYGAPVLHSR